MQTYWIIGIGIGFMILERIMPDRELPPVPTWWPRAILLNLCQLGVVILAGVTWDVWTQKVALFSAQNFLDSPLSQGLAGYVFSTFVYYWWHRIRHSSDLLWRLFHQVHHTPERLEVITSFYKHPFELVANSLLSASIAYLVLGLSVEGAAWVTTFSALGEYFYHLNVRTPRWVGFFIQRPEMHKIHHERFVHHSNFGDLPLWDMLFGTYRNPAQWSHPCGFPKQRETHWKALMLCEKLSEED